jgi:hypothetical protein
MVFVGILVAVILWLLPVKTPTLVLVGAGYAQNLAVPPNVHGWRTLQELHDWIRSNPQASFWVSDVPELLHDKPVELKKGMEWDQGLDRFVLKEKTVVVVMALHGGADENGLFFLFQDSDSSPEEGNRLRLEKVLDRLEKVGDKKQKVLILDPTQMTANAPLGMLHNNFVRVLKSQALNSAIERIPNLVVICSTDEDQQSWAFSSASAREGEPIVRPTVFGHYLVEGLKGAAATNDVVTAFDLFNYVSKSVTTWVADRRATAQTPILLPSGPEGTKRAQSILITRVSSPYQKPSESETSPDIVPPDLTREWERCAALRNRVPSPALYHPQLWRLYQDWLLRYEQLVLAGDKGDAEQVRDKLTNLHKELEAVPFPVVDAIGNSLPTAKAMGLGIHPLAESQLRDEWAKLWDQPDDAKRRTAWEDMQRHWKTLWEEPDNNKRRKEWGDTLAAWADQEKSVLPRLFELRVAELLFGAAAANPSPETRTKVKSMLPLIYGSATLKPVEIFYLALLLGRLPDPPPEESYLKRALETSRLAERVVLAAQAGLGDSARLPSYCETVFPWISDTLLEADKERRFGQDFLFASGKENWEKSLEYFNKAQALYQSAKDVAGIVRRALNARDTIMAELPYYSRWAAARRVTEDRQEEAVRDVDRAEALWKQVHELDEALAKRDLATVRAKLEKDGVTSDFVRLEQDFERYCKTLDDTIRPDRWHELVDALTVPCVKPELRVDLLHNLHRVSNGLDREVRREGAGAPTATPMQAQIGAERQGRMALAILGENWLKKQNIDFASVRNHIVSLNPENWFQSMRQAGQWLASAWQTMRPEIRDRIKEAIRPETDWTKTRDSLIGAERLCRQIDGSLVESLRSGLEEDKSPDPVIESRGLDLNQLLVALARRTFNDSWVDEPSNPYFSRAAQRYLSDAKKLIPDERFGLGGKPIKPYLVEFENTRGLVRENPKLDLVLAKPNREGDAHLAWTTEPTFPLEYHLTPGTHLPTGYAVTWADQKGDVQNAQLRRDRAVQPLMDDKGAPRSPSIAYTFERSSPDESDPDKPRTAEVIVKAWYRGRALEVRTPIDLFYQPDLVVFQVPPPKEAAVAVRADKSVEKQFTNAKVSIVLDCSGSMWEPFLADLHKETKEGADPTFLKKPVPEEMRGKRRFDKAVASLEKVLSGLDTGTIVSVSVFSQVDKDKLSKGNQIDTAPITVIRKPAPWKKTDLIELMDNVKDQIPWGETPLAEAIWRAKERDFDDPNVNPGFDGFKTILALTDGEDNLFAKTPELSQNGRLSIGEFLKRKFAGSGIQVNMVFFHDSRPEEIKEAKKARKQFEVIEKDLVPPGKILEATTKEQLLAYLRELLNLQRFKLYQDNSKLIGSRKGTRVSRRDDSLDNLAWSPKLVPTRHELRVHNFKKEFAFDNGDYLLVDVEPDGDGQVTFQQAVYGRQRFVTPKGEQKEVKGRLLSVVQNQKIRTSSSVQMMVMLEQAKEEYRKGAILRQNRPEWVWLEAKAKDRTDKPWVRSQNLERYPAPAWRLDLKNWPVDPAENPVPPVLSAWWLDKFALPSVQRLERDQSKTVQQNFKGFSCPDFTIEDAQIEKDFEGKPGSALVLRIRHAPGKRVVAQLIGGLMTEGRGDTVPVEHRFYSAANKYTVVFREIDDVRAKQSFEINFISLNAAQKMAEDAGTFVKDMVLPGPDNSPPPPRVPELDEPKPDDGN